MRNYMFPGLLKNIEFNIKNAYYKEAQFYEVGSTFVKNKKAYIETRKASFIIYGQDYDYYSISGAAEHLLKKISQIPIEFRKSTAPFLHPVNSSEIIFNGIAIGFAGEVHPDICNMLDFRYPAYAAELEISSLEKAYNQAPG